MSISSLVTKFQKNIQHYKSSTYNEAQLRVDFIDPFFELLGWDIKNETHQPSSQREVLVEEPLKYASSHIKKPDYTFRFYSDRKFFVEAKKPAIDILTSRTPAFQIRSYGYTAQLGISILTNFEYLVIYDTSFLPTVNDDPTHSRLKVYRYTDYEKIFDFLYDKLSRECVYSGQFDNKWNSPKANIQKNRIDNAFVNQINKWRLKIGQHCIDKQIDLGMEELNDLVQKYINCFLFLRVCEDRSIEPHGSLKSASKNKRKKSLLEKITYSNKKYNSGLFELDFQEEIIGNDHKTISCIIDELYFPNNIYSFSILPSDILGNVYEIFLGKELKIEENRLKLEDKPEHKDRDVVTTPTFIINKILEKTISPLCKDKTDEEILSLRICDISCGSGAFLLETFQLLQDKLVEYYISKNDFTQIEEISRKIYKLKFNLKRKLLTSCIYGTDKDLNAVTACKFGLLLKLLEDEHLPLEDNPILPDLTNNITYGNALIENAPQGASTDDIYKINPYEFKTSPYDAIVGNPPYQTVERIKQFTPSEGPLYISQYKTAYKQYDKYYLFIERALSLLKPNGRLGYIIPSKFQFVGAAKKLRKMLAASHVITEIVDFNSNQIFPNRTTYTCLFMAQKAEHETLLYTNISNLQTWRTTPSRYTSSTVPQAKLSASPWILDPQKIQLISQLNTRGIPLKKILGEKSITNGIQTSANKLYIHKIYKLDDKFIYFKFRGKLYRIEKDVTKPYFQRPDKKENNSFHSYKLFTPNSFVIYPYQKKENKIELIPLDEIERDYPYLYSFLQLIKIELSSPKRDIKPEPETDQEWYKYGRHQSLSILDTDIKIIVGILSQGYKYAIDTSKTFISSGGTAGYCAINPNNSGYSPYYIQAFLNSKYLEFFAAAFGEIFRGGYIARGTKVLKSMPVVPIDFTQKQEKKAHDHIVNLQKKIITLFQQAYTTANHRIKIQNKRQIRHKENELSQHIGQLYGLSSEEQALFPEINELYDALKQDVD
ncbi:Eco57I restriction-modification methylase domain-containing protein [Desulfobaculum bizertense]|uniref:site-specific DNA-methyltransferase (adenine-specific) n=1 Tax=Desulfobaculum bizertense DSM 18034 TaxID=1121442 RepID=A0A1T4W0V4_9BACT|nr:N-6 DNA methylase [Desulfobaculum bizertense]SKA70914.1 TaqI-like C-terminal specificity domain-containing protein [Desulfobaculum bizertense DSM 18034]